MKCVIGEQGVGLILFFNKKLIIIVLETCCVIRGENSLEGRR
jgi:hypothetical protein